LAGAYEFAFGAIIICPLIKIGQAIREKRISNEYFPLEKSNFWNKDKKFKWMNLLGLLVRAGNNIAF